MLLKLHLDLKAAWLLPAGYLFLAGCTVDISHREPYRQFTGRTVYLNKEMELWLPIGDIEYNSHPYRLVFVGQRSFAYTSSKKKFRTGTAIAILPLGTPVQIEKAMYYNALDDVHNDALGEVFVPSLHESLPFAYTFWPNDFGPWTLTPPR